MARRKSRKPVTYDSKETTTVLGLLLLLLALTLYIAAFIETPEANVFTQIRLIFGQTTAFIGFVTMNVGLYFLGTDWPLSNRMSILSQLVLLVLIPAFITSLAPTKGEAIIARDAGLGGGSFGYFLAYDLFADTLVFAQYTPLILGIAILIFTPLALSLSVAQTWEYLSIAFGKLGDLLYWMFNRSSDLLSADEEPEQENTALEKASRFSDFKRDPQLDSKPKAPIELEPVEKPEESAAIQAAVKKLEAEEGVKVTTAELGELGLASSELKYPNWQLPPSSLLNQYKKTKATDADKDRNARIIEQTLMSFDIDAKVMDAFIGPSVVQYALDIPLGIKVSKVETLSPNLALALGVDSQAVRIETIPGTTYLGIEVPRNKRDEVKIRELIESEEMQEKKTLPVTVGKDIHGKSVIGDIQKMPHLLIAGATGSGKSILTNSFIVTMLMNRTPDELRMILVDPKQVELSDYNGIPHLLTPVITEMDKVVNALKWLVTEMERRYTTLAKSQVRDIGGYNTKLGFAAMPYIVVVIDEMADMMMTANRVEAETAIVRLAQKARAVGIHLILATQRPSVNVITGLIKANIPGRIGMSVTSGVDSRVILDDVGAESLMGKGDLLYKAPDKSKSARLQGGFVSQEEVIRVVDFIKAQVPEVEYAMSILEPAVGPGGNGEPVDGANMSDDDLFMQAVRIVVNYQKGSSSFLQRKLNIGFNRAARLLEEMEEAGIVGPAEGSKPREVLITDVEEYLQSKQNVPN